MNNSMAEKMTEKCRVFWTALFKIFDERKYRPKINKDSYSYSYALDDRFDLRGSSDRIWLVDKRNGRAQCIQKDEQVNDEFPYTKILDKYLKLSVLSDFVEGE